MDSESREHLPSGFQQQRQQAWRNGHLGYNLYKMSANTLKLGSEGRIKEPVVLKGPCTLRQRKSPRSLGLTYDLRQDKTANLLIKT